MLVECFYVPTIETPSQSQVKKYGNAYSCEHSLSIFREYGCGGMGYSLSHQVFAIPPLDSIFHQFPLADLNPKQLLCLNTRNKKHCYNYP